MGLTWCLDGAEDADGEKEDGGDQGKGSGDDDADEAEGEQEEPDERVEDEGEQSEGPAGNEEEAEEEEFEHRRSCIPYGPILYRPVADCFTDSCSGCCDELFLVNCCCRSLLRTGIAIARTVLNQQTGLGEHH